MTESLAPARAQVREAAVAVRAHSAHVIHTFARIGLGPSDLAAGVRFCATVAVAAAALFLAGRPDAALFAVIGAFPVMYGRGAPGRGARMAAETHAFVLVGAAVLGGSLLSAAGTDPWQLVAWETGFCSLACLYAARARTTPPGPFFALLAFGASASAHPEGGLATALCAFTATAVPALLVGIALPAERQLGTGPSVGTGPAATAGAPRAPGVARHATAVAAAGLLGLCTGAEHAYWAMASSVTPLAAIGLAGMGVRGLHRVVGSCAGVLVAFPLLVLPQPAALLLVAVAVLALPTEAYMRTNYALAMVFFTPLILAMTALADPGSDGQQLVVDRGIQTVLGALVGLGVGIGFEVAARRRRRQRDGTMDRLGADSSSGAVRTPCP